MKCIIPVAGYATRLFPLTENFPKALIEVGGKPMLDHIIQKVLEIGIDDIHIVSNNKYFPYFEQRKNNHNYDANIAIYNDGTLSNEDRLGAIGDINFVKEKASIDDDVLVILGDNLFEFSLKDTFDLFQKQKQTTTIGHDVETKEKAKSFGVVEIDGNQKVLSFEEKPENPKSTFVSIGVYFYPKEIFAKIPDYMQDKKNQTDPIKIKKRNDAPGNFPAWLVNNGYEVYANIHSEKRYDIGTHQSLEEVRKYFQ